MLFIFSKVICYFLSRASLLKTHYEWQDLALHRKHHGSTQPPLKGETLQNSSRPLTKNQRRSLDEIFKCGECDKTFKDEKYLKCHVTVHKTFKDKKYRKQQSAASMKDKPLKCLHCPKFFKAMKFLKAHSRLSGHAPILENRKAATKPLEDESGLIVDHFSLFT